MSASLVYLAAGAYGIHRCGRALWHACRHHLDLALANLAVAITVGILLVGAP